MLLKTLKVGCFRIFREKKIAFYPGVNLILGKNGVGKTSLLEAIHIGMLGRSFKNAPWEDLIHSQEQSGRIEILFEKVGIDQSLKVHFTPQEKKVLHNVTTLPTLSALLGILQGTLLAPQDINLVQGSPHERRSFLDYQLAQIDPYYTHHLIRYHKALKQRNSLLKTKKVHGIEPFEEILAQAAQYIMQERDKLITRLNTTIQPFYREISHSDATVQLKYHPSAGLTTSFLSKLESMRRRDLEQGYTSVGPHRDDLDLAIKEKEAKQFASEGEKRSLAASLKLTEWHLMKQRIGEDPILLIDDFGISLDSDRMQAFMGLVKDIGQVIITSPNPIPFKSTNIMENVIS